MRTVPKRGLIGLAIMGSVVAGLAACNTTDEPPAVQGTAQRSEPSQPTKIVAKNTGSPESNTTVLNVTVYNHDKVVLNVNPFFFTVTDTHGQQHPTYVTGREDELPASSVNPGEHVSGRLVFRGVFKPKTINFEENGFDESARAAVQ